MKLNNVVDTFKHGYYRPMKIRVYRVVLYALAAVTAMIASPVFGFIPLFFIALLLQSEIFLNARNGTSNPNAKKRKMNKQYWECIVADIQRNLGYAKEYGDDMDDEELAFAEELAYIALCNEYDFSDIYPELR